MVVQFLQSHCMLLSHTLMPTIFRHTQDISRWHWTNPLENKLLNMSDMSEAIPTFPPAARSCLIYFTFVLFRFYAHLLGFICLYTFLPMLGSFGECVWRMDVFDAALCRLRSAFTFEFVAQSECNGAWPRVATHRRISILRALHKLRYCEGSGNSCHVITLDDLVNTEWILSQYCQYCQYCHFM